VTPFELTVGMNGRIWVKSNECKHTIFLVDAINRYADVSESKTEEFVDSLFKEDMNIDK
jgi:exosome complex RNA-binding protein Rrp4